MLRLGQSSEVLETLGNRFSRLAFVRGVFEVCWLGRGGGGRCKEVGSNSGDSRGV